MKKVLDFILSFIVPKKMKRYRNLNIFLIVLIFLGCALLCAGVSNLALEGYVKRNKENFRLFSETYDLPSGNEEVLPKFNLNQKTYSIEDFAGEQKIFETTFTLEDSSELNLTLVYEPDVYINDLSETKHDDRIIEFNIIDYYNYVPERDADGNLKEKNILVIITAELIYYFNNHGYDLYKNAEGSYTRYLESTGWSIMESKHVLPKDESEIVYLDTEKKELDYSKWTLSASLGDTTTIGDTTYVAYATGEDAYFLPATSSEVNLSDWSLSCNKDDTITHNGVEYQAKTKINRNLHNVFVSENTQRIGVFSLYQASKMGVNFSDLNGDNKATTDMKLVVEAIGDLMVKTGVSQLENYNTIYAMIFIFIMPLLWTFALWVMSRKFGELTRFKEYYAICAVSYIVPSILTALFTLFSQPYAFIAQYAMFIQLGFYIYMVYKINNPKVKNNNNTSSTNKIQERPAVDLNVKTEKVTEIKSNAAQME